MLFGLAQITSLPGAVANARFEADYDNLVLSISLPEPSSLLLLGTVLLALAGIGAARRRAD